MRKKSVGVLNSLSLPSNKELNSFVDKALKAGGREYRDPQDYGFMQLRSFEDPDGHNWEALLYGCNQVSEAVMILPGGLRRAFFFYNY